VTQGELNLDSPGRNGNWSREGPKVVSERLGHSSVAFAMDVYTASLPDMQEGAAQKLQEMLG
jgi:integrase